jgi:CelD/BcsL family acetyltransferase involved in cellulose biosynthesis
MDATLQQGGIGELLPDWAELFAADDRATPFQSHAWARAWWRHWAEGSRPWLLTVREAGRLVGLAPLRSWNRFGMRLLRVNEEPGDYWDLLALPEDRAAVEEVIGRELLRRDRDWDAIVLSRLPQGSSTAGSLARCGLRAVHRTATPCPALALPDSFDAYLATLPRDRRSNVRRRLRKLDSGQLELRTPSVEDLPAAIGRWQALRIRQWRAMGKRITPEHTEPRFRDFLVEATTELVPAGLALVWEFLRAGQLVGSFINFCNAGTFYHYLGAFDPELGHLSIGNVATAEGIRSSIAAGRSYYDFGRGKEAYKYWYGAADRLSPTVVLVSRRPRSLLAGGLGALTARLRS